MSVRAAWMADENGVAKTTFDLGEPLRYYGEFYNGTGSPQTLSDHWTASGPCGALLDQSANDTVGLGTTIWYLTGTIPLDACEDNYTLAITTTFNTFTTTQSAVFAVATPTPTPTAVTVRAAWTADEAGATKSTFDPGETVRYSAELYNGTGITQTVSSQWQAWGACGWLLNHATNESVSPATNLWYIPVPLPTGNCGGVYTYTLGVTYNSLTTTQSVTFTVTGPTPTPPPTGPETINIDYTYDPLYRLTRATYTGSAAASYRYTYDAVGNRLTQHANGTLTTYGYDHANRLTSVNGQSYTWDDNGNLTSDGLLTYAYDQANRLRTVVQGANTYTFGYNGVGDRLSQTVGVTTTRYVLDPSTGLTQVLADGTNTYLYGNGRLAQYQTAMQYFGADGLGSVRQLYDVSGQVIATNRYDPYGNVMGHSGEASGAYGFAGEWADATGLTYLRARFYSPAQGRFMTEDMFPGNASVPRSLYLYAYACDDPVNLIDPSGLQVPPPRCKLGEICYTGTVGGQVTGPIHNPAPVQPEYHPIAHKSVMPKMNVVQSISSDCRDWWVVVLYIQYDDWHRFEEFTKGGQYFSKDLPLGLLSGAEGGGIVRRDYQGLWSSTYDEYEDTIAQVNMGVGVPGGGAGMSGLWSEKASKANPGTIAGDANLFVKVGDDYGVAVEVGPLTADIVFSAPDPRALGMPLASAYYKTGITSRGMDMRYVLTSEKYIADVGGVDELGRQYAGSYYVFVGRIDRDVNRNDLLGRWNLKYLKYPTQRLIPAP